MCFNIQYGNQDKTKLYEIAKSIAQDINKNDADDFGYTHTLNKINNTFFGGHLLSPKSFSDLIAPFSIPKCLNKLEEGSCKVTKKTLRIVSVFCYLEIIPGIGSLVGMLASLIRAFTIESKQKSLEKAVQNWNQLPENAPEIERFQKAVKVFNKAVKLTYETNLYWGSLTACMPLYKLFLGFMRGLVFNLHRKR